MDPMVFKRRFWIGVGIIAASMVIFAATAFFVGGDIGAAANAITTARSRAAEQSAMITAYTGLKADAATAATYQTAMDKLLSSQDNLIGFPSQINNIAHNDGVDLTFTFNGNPTLSTGGSPGSIGFTMNAIGSLSNIITFIGDVESNAPIMLSRIDTFDLTQGGSNYALAATGRVFFK